MDNHLKLIFGLNIYFVVTALVGILIGSGLESLGLVEAPASRLIGLGIMLPISWVGVYFYFKKLKPKGSQSVLEKEESDTEQVKVPKKNNGK